MLKTWKAYQRLNPTGSGQYGEYTEAERDEIIATLITKLAEIASNPVIAEIAAERRRQIEVEGWTPEHDDEHTDGELPKVAACYALGDPAAWPKEWSLAGWKPKNRRRDLIRAGTLIVAEIERLDRAKAKAKEAPCQHCGGNRKQRAMLTFGSSPEACPVCATGKAKEACQCCGGSGMVTGIGYFGEISDPEALANCPVCSGLGWAKAKEAGNG